MTYTVIDMDIVEATPEGESYMPQALVGLFRTLAGAEDFIAVIEESDPEKVTRGGYGID